MRPSPEGSAGRRDPLRPLAALIPFHREPPPAALVAAVRRHVDVVLLVDDGSAAGAGRCSDVLRLQVNRGKGHAIAAGLQRLLSRQPPPAAVIVLDADGQHPPEAIPAFVAAAHSAELVVGDRFGDLAAMPLLRRNANRLARLLLAARTRRRVRDTQCGMRLLRGRALEEVRFAGGRYEAETGHLRRCLHAGVPVSWVPIPTLYAGERSSFRTLRDALRVLRELVR